MCKLPLVKSAIRASANWLERDAGVNEFLILGVWVNKGVSCYIFVVNVCE